MIEAFLAPFRYPFMLEAIGVGTLVATACSLLSCYIVLKGWSLLGDAIAHAVLPGVVIASALGFPIAIGAFVAGIGCALGAGFIQSHSRVKEDAALGVVFTGMFAAGIVLLAFLTTEAHITHILFGNILGIEPEDFWQTLIGGGVTLLVLLLKGRDLKLFCFDPTHARSIGLNIAFLRYLFLALLSAAVVAGVQAVGVIMVVALLITPGCIGYLLSNRFGTMSAIAVVSAVSANLVGILASYHLNVSPAGAIVVALSLIFAVVLVAAPEHGLLASRRARRAAATERLRSA
ncbi:metal ABC transporter permease [Roseomonas terrae]|jgi:ABC-type Mn2+/Zn2+ transport system permease subunit|uniref:Metal ABC transporter permease n=1 Tax=Neoroseomonas terrae TaxID=424799 RepID=A0ABS5EBH2_9PROT|nr:metal ABC transporter permease [Neoroseomonas terrae]MBR0648366.1 metal ABC transporter permease [Neoroseomonas terrae]